MGKKHSIINHCYKTNCNECGFNCIWTSGYGPLFKKIRNLKQGGRVDHISIEEFRSKLRYQPKGVDERTLKEGANPPTAIKN